MSRCDEEASMKATTNDIVFGVQPSDSLKFVVVEVRVSHIREC